MTHRYLPRVLVAVGALLAILSILAVWISRQALETDQWAQTSSELLEDPAVQSAVSGYLVDTLYANVDVAGELRSALPRRAQPLAAPAASALRQGAEQVADRALDRPRVQLAWEQANRAAHATLVRVVEGGGDVVGTSGGVVTLDLKTMLDQIAQRTGLGSRVVDRVPDSAAQITVLRSDQLSAVQSVARALKPLALVLVLLMLACFGGAIALARGRRRETLRACGIALMFAGAVALVARSLVGDAVVDDLATTASVEPAVRAAWDIGTSLLVGVAGATIAYGAFAVLGAWLAGPMQPAVAVRRALAPYLRDARLTYGVLAAVVLVILLWGPTEATRRPLPALVLIALLAVGVEALRRYVAAESPEAVRGAGPGAGAMLSGFLRGSRDATGARRGAPEPAVTTEANGDPSDLAVAQLERLDDLHRTGALEDEEFAAAKKRVIAGA